MVNPYIDSRFWQAYAELYWPHLDSNDELRNFGSALADALPSRNSDQPVTILLLGFGFGGVEMPILYHLKRRSNARLRCICIDQALPPMRFAQYLLQGGLGRLPKAAEEMVARFAEFAPSWHKGAPPDVKPWLTTPDGDEFHFVQDDLNWESKTKVFPALPSKWHERLAGVLSPDQRFDLILGAFSFFHIGWWRSVLAHSLERLKAGGLFLHAKVEGDEGLFEGRPGLRISQNNLATDFFLKGFFANSQVEAISRKPRAASASQPFEIEAFLSRLQNFGLERLGDSPDERSKTFPDRYTVSPRVGVSVYAALLETQGFGTFRHVAAELTKRGGDYAAICSQLQEEYRNNTNLDTLSIPFQWSVWRLSDSNSLKSFPLYHRLRQRPCPAHKTPTYQALHEAYISAYELSSPLVMHEQLDDVKLIASILGRKINQQGLLHDDCLALEFGLYPEQAGPPTWSFLGNALHTNASSVSTTLHEVALYLMLLAERSKRSGFSNTKALLEVILPLFQKAPLFVYDLDETEYSFTHESHLDFEQFRFTVPRLAQENQGAWDEARGQLELRFNPSGTRVLAAGAPDVLTTEDFECNEHALARLFDCIKSRPDQCLEDIGTKLKHSFTLQGHLHQSVREKIEKFIDDPMAFTVRCLKLLSIAKQVVFYPARFELDDRSIGKDVIIAVYSRRLSTPALCSEFLKFDRIFQQIKQKRTAQEGEERGRSILAEEFAHEVKHAARAISSRWLTSPKARALLTRKGDIVLKNGQALKQVIDQAHLALVPGLFDHAAKVFRLWSAAGIQDLLKGEAITPASRLEEFISLAHKLSVSNQLFQSTEGLELSSIKNLEAALGHLSEADSNTQRYELVECHNGIVFREEWAQEMALDFVRLFVSLFTNFRQHAKEASILRCRIEFEEELSGFVVITLENEAKETASKRKQGTKVIVKLVGRLRGSYSSKRVNSTLFTQTMRFPADCFSIGTSIDDSQ